MNTEPKTNLKKAKLAHKYLIRVLKLLSRAGKIYIFPIVFLGLLSSIIPSTSVRIMQEIVNSLQLSAENLG